MSHSRLTVESGEDQGREFLIDRPLIIGRAAGCDVVLNDESCSRMHARLTPQGAALDDCRVEDLGSTNGTLVNGERISAGPLADGDRVMIGGTVLRFHRGEPGGSATVVLGVPARDSAAVLLAQPVERAERAAADPLRAAVQNLLDAAAGAPDRLLLARALCRALLDLLPAERAALLLDPPAGGGTHAGIAVSVPEMRFEPNRAWVQKALESRRALLLADDGGHSPLYALAAPVKLGRDSWLLAYADRRSGPFNAAELARALELLRAVKSLFSWTRVHSRLQEELVELRGALRRDRRIVGESEPHQQVIAAVRRAAGAPQSVLFIGETGTGKELFARLLHDLSPRAAGRFVAVNCSATPEELRELEILGSDGAALAASGSERPCALERAAGGTLFLDEIDALDLPAQSRLAFALRERSLKRANRQPIPIDVRLVAASDRDLSSHARSGFFHEDLLALLALGTIPVPPLRERPDDIPLLADHFLRSHARTMNRTARRLTPRALAALTAYAWPGNVRELSNIIERAVMLSSGPEVTPDLLPLPQPRDSTHPAQADCSLAHAEKLAIERALAQVQFKKGRAAQLLGISWPTLRKKIAAYQIQIPPRP